MDKKSGVTKYIVLFLETVFIFAFILFFPLFFINAQTIDISVTANVSSTSTPPVPFCGDGICNGSETCSSCLTDCPTGCGGGGGGGGGVYVPANTTIIFKGRAYPLANLTILKNDSVIATFKAESTGLFEKEITAIAPGTYGFSIFAEDTEKRKSVTLGFTVGILADRITTISGIFISPTIDLGPTQVEKGQSVIIRGQAFPESKINIFISSNEIIKSASATKLGKWNYSLDTGQLTEEEHKAKAQAFWETGEQSSFSQTLSFLVVKKGAIVCKGPDLNFDGKINLVDFSILLYYWQQKKPVNICADINQDGIVNLIDFSIMMYYWTK